jgi:hypothetical protein
MSGVLELLGGVLNRTSWAGGAKAAWDLVEQSCPPVQLSQEDLLVPQTVPQQFRFSLVRFENPDRLDLISQNLPRNTTHPPEHQLLFSLWTGCGDIPYLFTTYRIKQTK